MVMLSFLIIQIYISRPRGKILGLNFIYSVVSGVSPSVVRKEMVLRACSKARFFYSNAVCYIASLGIHDLSFIT